MTGDTTSTPGETPSAPDPAPGGAPAATPTPAPATPPPLGPAATGAFSAGWMIALLYGRVPELRLSESRPLPTINELSRSHRAELILGQLQHLISGPLAEALTPPAGADAISIAELGPIDDLASPELLRQRLRHFHIRLLIRLTVYDRRLGEAYSLGRSLSDTCWQPKTEADFRVMFGKYRVANLQAWLADLAPSLEAYSASGVSQGLDHWSAWLAANAGLDWPTHGPAIQRAARAQGEQWRALLTGEKDPKSLLTPEGYVAAGEAALSRASRIVRQAAIHFWVPISIVGLVTLLAIMIALRYTAGATKLWGSVVSLAAGVGVTGKSLQATAKQLANDATQPLLNLAESDAIGWAATCLPAVGGSPSQNRKLRKLGVSPPAPDLVPRYVDDYAPPAPPP